MLSLYYHKSVSYQSQHRPTLMRKDQQEMESNDWIHFKRRNHQIKETLLYTFDWRVPAIKQNGWLTSGLDTQIMWLLSGLSLFDYTQSSFIDPSCDTWGPITEYWVHWVKKPRLRAGLEVDGQHRTNSTAFFGGSSSHNVLSGQYFLSSLPLQVFCMYTMASGL